MEKAPQGSVYGFYDGDFTFHHVEYPGGVGDSTFRVRIDNETPQERALENTNNPNAFAPGWTSLRPATKAEVARWLAYFERSYPLRHPTATEGLRHLRMHGPTGSEELPVAVAVALLRMTFGQTVVRNFNPQTLAFVTIVDDKFQLTEDGLWLTGLMK